MTSFCIFEALDTARGRCSPNGDDEVDYSDGRHFNSKCQLARHPNIEEMLKIAEAFFSNNGCSPQEPTELPMPLIYTFVGTSFEACDQHGMRVVEMAAKEVTDEQSGRQMVIRRHEYVSSCDADGLGAPTGMLAKHRKGANAVVVAIESFDEVGCPLICRVIIDQPNRSEYHSDPLAGLSSDNKFSDVELYSNSDASMLRENTDSSIGGITNRSSITNATNAYHNISGYSQGTSPASCGALTKESSLVVRQQLNESDMSAGSPSVGTTLVHTLLATHTPTIVKQTRQAGGQMSTQPHKAGLIGQADSIVRAAGKSSFPSEPAKAARHHDVYGDTARALDLSAIMHINSSKSEVHDDARAEQLRSQQEMMKNELLRMQQMTSYQPNNQTKGIVDISAIHADEEGQKGDEEELVIEGTATPPELTDTMSAAQLDPFLVASLYPMANTQCIDPILAYTMANGTLPIDTHGPVALLSIDRSSTCLAPSVAGLTYSSSNPPSSSRSPDPNRFFVSQPSAKSLAATSHIASTYHSGNVQPSKARPSQLAPCQIVYSYDGTSAHWSQKPFWFQTVLADHVQRTMDYQQDLSEGWRRWKVGALAGMERSVIMNSIDEVCAFLRVSRNGFYAAVGLLDTFLSVCEAPTSAGSGHTSPNQDLLDANNFRCLIIAAVYVASKIHDVQPPPVKRVIEALGVPVAPDTLCNMELRLFSSLHFCTHPLTLLDVTAYFTHFPLRTSKTYTLQRWSDVANKKRLQQQSNADGASAARDDTPPPPTTTDGSIVSPATDLSAPLPLPIIDSLRANLRATIAILCDIVVRSPLAVKVPALLLGVAVFRAAVKVSNCASIVNDDEDEDAYDSFLPQDMAETEALLGGGDAGDTIEKAQLLLGRFEEHYQRKTVGHGGFNGFMVRVLRGLLGTPAMPPLPLESLQSFRQSQVSAKREAAEAKWGVIQAIAAAANVSTHSDNRAAVHGSEFTPTRNNFFSEEDDNIKSRSCAPSPQARYSAANRLGANVSISMSDNANAAATSPSTNIGNTSYLVEDEHTMMMCGTPVARAPHGPQRPFQSYLESDSAHVSMGATTPIPQARPSGQLASLKAAVDHELNATANNFDEGAATVMYYLTQCELEVVVHCRLALLGPQQQSTPPAPSLPSIFVTRYGEPFIQSMIAAFSANN